MFIREPIYSATQFPPSRPDGPFIFHAYGPLNGIQQELHWRLFDFCRIHQIVYKEISYIDAKLDSLGVENIKFTGEIEPFEEYQKSRLICAVMDKDIENNRVVNFVDHMTVVGLWAIAEQFLGKVFRGYKALIDNCPPESVQHPYRWDALVNIFTTIGIDLLACENIQNADECRVLNNAIKHDPTVGNRLMSFPYFVQYQGKRLEAIPLEMQRYLNGVSDFLGSLIENADQKLSNLGFKRRPPGIE